MGGTGFTDTAPVTADVRDAYNELVDEARRAYDSNPCSGQINATSGVSVPIDTVMAVDDAFTYRDLRYEDLRWDNGCEALRVGERPVLSTRTVTRNLRVPAGTTVDKVVAASVKLKPGEAVAGITMVAPEGAPSGPGRVQSTSVRAVAIAAGKGRTETRFFIIRSGSQAMPRWESGYPAQAAARAVLTAALPKEVTAPVWTSIGFEAYDIISMTRRVGGAGLVTATVIPVAMNARYTITIEKRGPLGPQTLWFFYGIANS